MATITFDTLKLTKRLEESGFAREQAEAQAEALAEAMESGIRELATKHDVDGVRQELRQFAERADGRFTLLQWMLGFNLAATVALLWMMFRLLSA
jgi:hypothetical protein